MFQSPKPTEKSPQQFNTPPALSETTTHANPLSTPRQVEELPDYDPHALSMSPSTSLSPNLATDATQVESPAVSEQAIWSGLPRPPAGLLPWDQDELHDACHACKSQFSSVHRRHHCRQCGHIFCSSCSSRTAKTVTGYHAKSVRVCDDCYEKDKWKTARRREAGEEQQPRGGGATESCQICHIS